MKQDGDSDWRAFAGLCCSTGGICTFTRSTMALETEKGGPQHASYDMGEPKAQLYDDKGMKRSNMEQ